MKKYIFFIFLLFTILGKIQAQSRFHIDLDYHYNLGFSEKILDMNYGRKSYKMGGSSLRLSTRYDVTTNLSAGIGAGLDRYTETDFNTMPIFATLRYNPLKKVHNAYVFSDIGYAFPITKDYNPGFTGKIGVGYLLAIAKHFGMNFQIAYDLKDFRKIPTISYDEESLQNRYYYSNSIRHSISFGVGVSF